MKKIRKIIEKKFLIKQKHMLDVMMALKETFLLILYKIVCPEYLVKNYQASWAAEKAQQKDWFQQTSEIKIRCQVHQHCKSSFYARGSQKHN